MSAFKPKTPGVEVFLRLTDYVKGQDLCHLSADSLQLIVCGTDGKKLERIQSLTRVESVQFVSAPFPGFRIGGNCETFVQLAVVKVEKIMEEIRKACSRPIPKKSCSTPRNDFYHPLFSANQYHLIAAQSPSPGLLPIPTMVVDECPPERQLSDEEYRQLIRSPYLSAYKRKVGILKSINSVPSEAVTEAGDSSPELLTRESSETDNQTMYLSEFDQVELAGCLPGVAGVRQSKDYKRIRRKISEIDELLKRPFESLDHCQRVKISKRKEYVDQLRHMLLNGFPEEKDLLQDTEDIRENFSHTTQNEEEIEEVSQPKTPLPILGAVKHQVKKQQQPTRRKTTAIKQQPQSGVPPQVEEVVRVSLENESSKEQDVSIFLWLYTLLIGLVNEWLLPFVLCWVSFFIGDEHVYQQPRLAALRSAR